MKMVKYRLDVEWERLSLLRKNLTAQELDCFLEGLKYGIEKGKPKNIRIYTAEIETSE
jgi:hypothetical protein